MKYKKDFKRIFHISLAYAFVCGFIDGFVYDPMGGFMTGL